MNRENIEGFVVGFGAGIFAAYLLRFLKDMTPPTRNFDSDRSVDSEGAVVYPVQQYSAELLHQTAARA